MQIFKMILPFYSNPTFRQYLAAVCWHLGGLNLGIYLGWASITAPMLQSRNHPVIGQAPLTNEELSYSTSLPFIAGISVAILWGYIANKLGRKITGYLSALCYIASYVLSMEARSINMFILSRIVGGIGYCSVLFNSPLYIAEISEQKNRGRLTGIYVLMEYLGTLGVYIVGSLCSFQCINMFSLMFAIVSLLVLFIFPESPVYYLKNDMEAEARRSLEWFRCPKDHMFVDKELQRLKETFILDRNFKIKYVFTKHTLVALIIALYLQWAMHTIGINYIIMYTVNIFLHSSNVFDPYMCTVISGILNSFSPALYFIITNRVGRKVILMVSYGLLCLILGSLGTYYYCLEHYFSSPDMFNYIPVVCISLYWVTFSGGAGPVTHTLFSELFSSEVRNAIVPMTYIWNGFISFLILKLVPTVVMDTVHLYGIFWFFSLSAFVSVIFTIVFIPETKDKPFPKVVQDLANKAFW